VAPRHEGQGGQLDEQQPTRTRTRRGRPAPADPEATRTRTSPEAVLRAVVAHAPVVIFALDQHGVVTLAEGQGLHTLGLTSVGIVGHNAFALYGAHPDVLDKMRRALAGEATSACIDIAGRVIEIRYAPLTDAQGDSTGAIGVGTDVTERVRAEEALRASEARFRALSEHSSDMIAVLDAANIVRYASPSTQHVLGYTPAELEGRPATTFVDPDDLAQAQATFAAHLREPGSVRRIEFRVRHKDGSWRMTETIANNRLHDPAVRGILLNSRDITVRKQAEEALHRQALHDALTGLPNRTLLGDRVGHALAAAHRDHAPLALFVMDLDRFKEVNDTLGHDAGDALLREVSRRLQGALRASDTVARLGGDEFAVLLPGDDRDSAVATARKLLDALGEPVTLREQGVVAGGSIGIALYPAHGADAATLLRHADVAMYAAKRAGTGHALYTPAHDQHTPGRLALISALHGAIARGELRLYYQPTVDVADGRVRLVEALARWQHPEQGLLPPDAFIPLAEQTGLIVPLTRWALDTAVRQVRAWRDDGLDLGVAVNLSARALHDPDLPAAIAALLAAHAVPAARLRVELTESAVMAHPTGALDVLTRLAGLGVRIAIDDFGTGYSSLAYLTRLPVDEIKIDKSFVTHMTTESDDATIVASTIGLGHSLGLSFVAEGVEDARTWQTLEALSCDGVQGFYVSRALPADELARWLRGAPWMGGSARAET